MFLAKCLCLVLVNQIPIYVQTLPDGVEVEVVVAVVIVVVEVVVIVVGGVVPEKKRCISTHVIYLT